MAVDVSIQVFAYELFNTILIDHGIISREPMPKALFDRVYCDYRGESNVTSDIIRAVYCRQVIFHNIFRLQFEYTNISMYDSPSDYMAHLYAAYSSKEFKDLKLFERVFATSAFAVEMALFCFYKSNAFSISDIYLCWAMYFDMELKGDFYSQGGWQELKNIAKSYLAPFFIIRTCVDFELMYSFRSVLHSVPLEKLVDGMQDFNDFQTFSDSGEHLTRAKTWAKYRTRNNCSQKSNQNNFDLKTFEGLEHFLRRFKFSCGPLGEMGVGLSASGKKDNKNSSVNADLENATNKLSECEIKSPKAIKNEPKSNGLSSFANIAHAPPIDIQTKRNGIQQASYGDNMDLTSDFSDNNNVGILSIYSELMDVLKVDDVQTALCHTPVFMLEQYKAKKFAIDNALLKEVQPTKSKVDQQENIPLSAASASQVAERIKRKKKYRKKTGHENGQLDGLTRNSMSKNSVKLYSNDTKNILKMALVLGCEPAYNFVQSTLTKNQ